MPEPDPDGSGPLEAKNGSIKFQLRHDAYVSRGDWLAIATNQNKPFRYVQVFAVNNDRIWLTAASCDSTCWAEIGSVLTTTPILADGVDRRGIAYNLSLSSGGYLIRDNHFGKNGGRGLLLQAPNGVVISNVVQESLGPCIMAVADAYAFTNGPGPSNVGIIDNDLNRCGNYENTHSKERNAALSVGTSLKSRNDSGLGDTFSFVNQMVITKNRIMDIPRSGVSLSRSSNIDVTRNIFSRVATKPNFRLVDSDATVLQLFDTFNQVADQTPNTIAP